ncbi:alpha/beta hydrolase [Virgisporangium aurantiacum]
MVEARGFTFEVSVEGPADAAGTVLLLHGFPQNGTMWSAVRPALHAAGLRTVAPDQRGYSPGARPDDPAVYTAAEGTADALAILDALGITGPVHLVGHDWGAIVGWYAAAHHPARFRTWTAVSVPHQSAVAHALATDEDQRQRSAYIRLFRIPGKAEDTLLEDDGRRLRAIFGDSGLDAADIDRYVAPLLDRAALTGALNWYRGLRRDAPDLPPVTIPTTYVWSDQDLALGRTGAEKCAEYVTGPYEFVELRGVSHWIPDQEPKRLAEAILTRVNSAA